MKLLEALGGLIDTIFKPLNALFKKAEGPVRFDDRPPEALPVGPTELKEIPFVGPSRPIDIERREDGLVYENPRWASDMERAQVGQPKGR